MREGGEEEGGEGIGDLEFGTVDLTGWHIVHHERGDGMRTPHPLLPSEA